MGSTRLFEDYISAMWPSELSWLNVKVCGAMSTSASGC